MGERVMTALAALAAIVAGARLLRWQRLQLRTGGFNPYEKPRHARKKKRERHALLKNKKSAAGRDDD